MFNEMKANQKRWNPILWVEGAAFSLLIALCWLAELVRIPHLLLGELFAADWRRALLRSLVISLVWGWVYLATRRLLQRLHYLERFLRICGWCRKVNHNGEWVTLESYFSSKFATQSTHSICPECLKNELAEIERHPKVPVK